MIPSDAFDTAVRVARACEVAAVPYAIGGAFAYGQHAIPRATNDVDINVFLEPDHLGPFFDAMQQLGIAVDRARAVVDSKREGLFALYDGPYRVDVFTPSINYAWRALDTRVRRPFGDCVRADIAALLGAEDERVAAWGRDSAGTTGFCAPPLSVALTALISSSVFLSPFRFGFICASVRSRLFARRGQALRRGAHWQGSRRCRQLARRAHGREHPAGATNQAHSAQ